MKKYLVNYIEEGITKQGLILATNEEKAYSIFKSKFPNCMVSINEMIVSFFQKEKLDEEEILPKKHRGLKNKVTVQYSLTGDYIQEYNSQLQASRATGVNRSNISKCCRGKIHCAGGYIWKFKDEKESDKISKTPEIKNNKKGKPVILLTSYGTEIKRYPSEAEAMRSIPGADDSGISRACITGNMYKGYYWRFADAI